MPNPVPRKYTVQLGPTFTPEVAGELAAWAEVSGRSVSEVTREAAEFGLRELREQWEDSNNGPLSETRLAVHVAAAAERGEKQAARRSSTDRATRAAAAANAAAAVKPAARRRGKSAA